MGHSGTLINTGRNVCCNACCNAFLILCIIRDTISPAIGREDDRYGPDGNDPCPHRCGPEGRGRDDPQELGALLYGGHQPVSQPGSDEEGAPVPGGDPHLGFHGRDRVAAPALPPAENSPSPWWAGGGGGGLRI